MKCTSVLLVVETYDATDQSETYDTEAVEKKHYEMLDSADVGVF
jgi:hypothetical protein